MKRFFLIGALAAILMPVFAAAQAAPAPASPPQTEKIIGVRVVGSQTIAPDAILYYLGIRVGDLYNPDLIRKNFDTLWNSGLFDDVRIDAEKGPGGVTLVFTVTERPTVTSVEFTGNRKLSQSQIHDKMKQEDVSIKVGTPLSIKDVEGVLQAIRDAYTENGFRSATVSWRLEGSGKTEKKLVFAIDEGEKIKIASIRFTGDTVFSAARLRLAMKKTKVAVWWRALSDNTVYNQANLDDDIVNIKHLYQDYGYKDIVAKDPRIDIFVANPKQKNPKKIRKKMRITIPLVEGEKYYFGKIDVATEDGGEPKVFPSAQLLKAFRYCKPGTVLSRELMVEALSEIEDAYKRRGYIYWFADPQDQKPTAARRVDILVKIYEGDQFTLGRVEFRGNTMTRDKVLRRALTVDEGQILNMEAFKKSVLKISQLGYFKLNEDPAFTPNNQTKTVDVVIKGDEASRNQLNFGAGYSDFNGFFGQFSFQTSNFLGRGEILSAAIETGRIYNYWNLGYTIPWFMDRNQTVGGSLYDQNTTFLNIDDRRKGFGLFYGRALGIFDSYSLGYGYQDIHSRYPVQAAPVPPGAPVPPLATSLVTGTTSAVTPSYAYDSTNDPFDPTRGHRIYASVELAGAGGTNYFVKPIAGATFYVPFLRNKYFGLHAEAGLIRPFGGHEIPIYERYYLGGEQSLRGYTIGSIIPLGPGNRIYVDDQGRILGGDSYAYTNIEYIFAQAGPAKLLAFVDAGNTWIQGEPVTVSGLRSSVGLEMRVLLPIFQAPLRFIYAWNLHPLQPVNQYGFPIPSLRQRRSGFDFSIGSTF